MVADDRGRVTLPQPMRARLIRLLVLTAALAAAPGVASAAQLFRLGRVPHTFVRASTLSVSLTARGSSNALTGWLSGAGRLTRLHLTPGHLTLPARTRLALPLTARVPDGLPAGRYQLIVCATRRTPARPGGACVRSTRFALIPSIAIARGAGTSVRPALDSSRAAQATIGPAGGMLSTTTANGSTLTLTVPAGALAGDEPLTMTPLASLGASGAKLAAGAQLGPDGLRLLQPASLAITPAQPVPAGDQAAFAYTAGGSQFSLVPAADGRAVAIPLLRLGGAGLASASGGRFETLAHRAPGDPLSAFLQQLAASTRQLRLQRLHLHPGGVANPGMQAVGTLGGFYNQFIDPLLRRAGATAPAFTTAAERAIAFEREVRLLGDGRLFAGQQDQRLKSLLAVALARQWRRHLAACDAGAGVGNLQTVLTLGQVAQALRIGSAIGGPAGITAAVPRCTRFTGQAGVQVDLANWQPSSSRPPLSQIVSTAVASGPVTVASATGPNEFALASPHLAVTEQVSSVTANAADQAAGCSSPALVSYSTDPAQMFAAVGGTLTVPDDLFDSGPAQWTYGLTVAGADMATWQITCPPAVTPTTFTQSPGAMAAVGAITSTSPVPLTAHRTLRNFSGSADIVSGQSLTAFVNGRGRVSVKLPN